MAALREQIEYKKNEIADLKKEIKAGEPEAESFEAIDDWQQNGPNWLDQMLAVTSQLPGTQDIYFNKMQFDAGNGRNRGRIRLQGQATERRPVEDALRALGQSGYSITPSEIPKNDKDSRYPHEADLELTIPKAENDA